MRAASKTVLTFYKKSACISKNIKNIKCELTFINRFNLDLSDLGMRHNGVGHVLNDTGVCTHQLISTL
jgi:hypothetical protein